MICPNCQTEAPPGNSFCHRCGTKIVTADSEITAREPRSNAAQLRNALLVVAAGAAVAVGGWLYAHRNTTSAADPGTPPTPSVALTPVEFSKTDQSEQLKVGDYVFKTKSSEAGEGELEITLKGTKVQSLKGGRLSLECCEQAWKNGSDLNGEGPKVLVNDFSGGAHCCVTWHVFSFTPALHELPTVDNGHADFPPLEDVNHDGKLELIMVDWTFAYWNTSFAESPAIRLIYRIHNDQYQFAADLMKKPAPSEEELRALAEKVDFTQPGENDSPPAAFWSNILDLIAGGNAASIPRYVEMTWPEGRAGKDEFLGTFYAQLHKSSHWSELNGLNGGQLK